MSDALSIPPLKRRDFRANFVKKNDINPLILLVLLDIIDCINSKIKE
jgi:hypothetical protein